MQHAAISVLPLPAQPVSALGFDILLDRPTVEDLAAGLGKRKSAIKTVLLDQSFAAGVGNWVADEVRDDRNCSGPSVWS